MCSYKKPLKDSWFDFFFFLRLPFYFIFFFFSEVIISFPDNFSPDFFYFQGEAVCSEPCGRAADVVPEAGAHLREPLALFPLGLPTCANATPCPFAHPMDLGYCSHHLFPCSPPPKRLPVPLSLPARPWEQEGARDTAAQLLAPSSAWGARLLAWWDYWGAPSPCLTVVLLGCWWVGIVWPEDFVVRGI